VVQGQHTMLLLLSSKQASLLLQRVRLHVRQQALHWCRRALQPRGRS
jgi:hypothetical protein